jgi:hypothetical protein
VAVSYEIVTHDRIGRERVHAYTGEDVLAPGSVVPIGGRYWLVERIEQARVERGRRATGSRCAIRTGGKRPGPFGAFARTHRCRATS